MDFLLMRESISIIFYFQKLNLMMTLMKELDF